MRVAPRLVLALCMSFVTASAALAQQLEIHYINVGWGNSMLVKGPDGTTVLIEAGNTGKGTSKVVPYLKSIGIQPANGLDYMIGGHQHCDHIGGLDEVIQAGYNVRIKNYNNGSSYQSSCATGWASAAAGTTAGAIVAMPVGFVIPLGNGAKITAVARSGQIIGGGSVSVSNENDLSIALLIQYGGFDMLWASDLGGGSIDQACTGRSTTQVDVETAIVQAISPGGAFPLITAGGIDVLNANHHGSESSTNQNWMNYSAPAVALIGTGAGQTSGWDFPRRDVLENVLLAGTSCITVPPALVLQSEEGSPTGPLTSFMGYSVGDIKITTNGQFDFTVSANGAVTQGPNEVADAGLPRTISIDDISAPDTVPPTASITAPSNGATVSGVVAVNANATDNVGVARVEFYLDNVLRNTDTAAPWSWSWSTPGATNGSHSLMAVAVDGAGNSNTSASVVVTVNNVVDTTPPTTAITSPAGGSTVSGTVAVNATAADNVAVASVEFYLDGVLKFTDTAAPYSWSWSSNTSTNGAHTLTSRAVDSSGNAGTSAPVSVTVTNTGDTQPPSAPANLTATAGPEGSLSITLNWSASTDNVGVTGYQIWRSNTSNGPYTQIATTTSLTYTDSGLSREVFRYYVKAFDAAGNVSAASNKANARSR